MVLTVPYEVPYDMIHSSGRQSVLFVTLYATAMAAAGRIYFMFIFYFGHAERLAAP